MGLRRLYRAGMVLGHKEGEHRLLKQGAVGIEGDRIVYVGDGSEAPDDFDEVMDVGSHLIMPGWINLHCHASGSPMGKSLLEDNGSPGFYMSTLYDFGRIRETKPEETRDVLRYSLVELLRSGVTTVVEMGHADHPDVFDEMGIRAYLIPGFHSATWRTDDGHQLEYDWDEKKGFDGLEANARWVEACRKRPDLIESMLGPSQADTCTSELLRETRRVADDLGCPIHIHAAQSHMEVGVMLSRHGQSPIEFLDSVSLLGSDVTVAHGIFTGNHPDSNLPYARDVDILLERQVNLAHCPWVFGRRGTLLHAMGAYLRKGLNIGLGTDTDPQDMLEEIRWAVVLSKAAENNPLSVSARDGVNAATLGGARALGRDDLGRIAPGSQADLLFIDLNHYKMRPVRDPIRNLIYSAGSEAVDKVMVAGKMRVDKGEVLGLDTERLGDRIQSIGERIWREMPEKDRAGRSVDVLSPPTFLEW